VNDGDFSALTRPPDGPPKQDMKLVSNDFRLVPTDELGTWSPNSADN
jgi:hypothetical protein